MSNGGGQADPPELTQVSGEPPSVKYRSLSLFRCSRQESEGPNENEEKKSRLSPRLLYIAMIRSLKISDSDLMLFISVNERKSTFYPLLKECKSVSVWFFALFTRSCVFLKESDHFGAKTPFTYSSTAPAFPSPPGMSQTRAI